MAWFQTLYMLHDPEFFRRAKENGYLVSWYNCGPPPRTAIGATASELRSYLWQAAKADLDVICWWGIQCWYGTGDVWRNRYSHWNSVMYPAHPAKPAWLKQGAGWMDSPPLDSIRWEIIRDGMEDTRYVTLLRARIAEARRAGRAAEADRAEAVLQAIWKDVFPTLNDYNPPYETILASRRKIAEAILALPPAAGK